MQFIALDADIFLKECCKNVAMYLLKLLNKHFVFEPLLIVTVLVQLQNICKKKLNRKMLERPIICYICEKLRVQGCQIGHSHSTRPQPIQLVPTVQKSSLRYHFSRNSWKLGSQKLLPQGHFWWGSKFFFFSLPSGPRGMFEPNSDK